MVQGKFLRGFIFMFLVLFAVAKMSSQSSVSNQLQKQRITKAESDSLMIVRGDFVELDFRHSQRIPDHHVKIRIEPMSKNHMLLELRSEPMDGNTNPKYKLVTKSLYISTNEYMKIIRLFNQISASGLNDISLGAGIVGDGTRCSLECGTSTNSIVYKVWTPEVQTKERKLEQFVSCFEYIKKLSGYSFREI
jgi:hypothetical protein